MKRLSTSFPLSHKPPSVPIFKLYTTILDPEPFTALIPTVNVPFKDVVPYIVPVVGLSVIPVGKLPEFTFQVIGKSPVACNVYE